MADISSSQVLTVVVIKTPAGLTRAAIDAGIEKSVPQYKTLPGLIRKYFTVGRTGFGGVYLWKNRASAEAWFNPAWHERVTKTYGSDGEVTYFDVPVAIEGTNVDGGK